LLKVSVCVCVCVFGDSQQVSTLQREHDVVRDLTVNIRLQGKIVDTHTHTHTRPWFSHANQISQTKSLSFHVSAVIVIFI